MSTILLLIALLAVVNIEGKEPCALDLIFLVDGSSSVCDGKTSEPCPNWIHAIEFIKKIVGYLNIGPDDSKVAFLKFGDEVDLRWNLNKYRDEASLLAAINSEKMPGGELTSSGGIAVIVPGVFNKTVGDRPNVTNVAIMIMDNAPALPEKETAALSAKLQKAANLKVMVVCLNSTSSECYESTAMGISSYPHENGVTYFMAKKYILIETVIGSLIKQLCVDFPDPDA